jgi:putative hydrolase of the HAD superfamily
MRGVLVPHSLIPESQQMDVEVVPDGVVADLTELIALIDGWL